ncbi:MAG: hypothetical protein WBX26_10200, partial [Candidatus Cybelea sp.]
AHLQMRLAIDPQDPLNVDRRDAEKWSLRCLRGPQPAAEVWDTASDLRSYLPVQGEVSHR